MQDIISRKYARAFGEKKYFTGKPCPRGHISKRWVCNGSCVTCKEIWVEKNPGYWKEDYKKTWLRRHFQRHRKDALERKSKYNKTYRSKNLERLSQYDK